MGVIRHESFARYTFVAIAIGGHVLLIALLSNSRLRDYRSAEPSAQNRGVLLLLELPPPRPSAAQVPERARSSTTRSPKQPASQLPLDTAIHRPSAKPSIDWYGEAESIAREADVAALALRQSGCDASHRPGSLRPKCKQRRSEYKWEPPLKRAGFAGGIPYVRLGRCVVALGGFGCALGKLPKESGDLFERMRDPDRPASSVPDVNQ